VALKERNGTRDRIRWIRREINGARGSSSPARIRRVGGEPWGSGGLPRFPRGSGECEAALSTARKRLVAVARRGEASIVDGDLRAPADFVLQLELLRRCGVKLVGGEEAGMRGDQMV
jgi:hypothetical protein